MKDKKERIDYLIKLKYPTRQDMRECIWKQKEYIDELEKKLDIAQQPLSDSEAEASTPKCLNTECLYYNEKYDMNCDANENLCEKCLGTFDKLKRCVKIKIKHTGPSK